jgi:hypothetical protein
VDFFQEKKLFVLTGILAALFCFESALPAWGQDDAASRFPPPQGFVREIYEDGSFPLYLRHLPLKPKGAVVRYYDGREKPNRAVAAAVVDISVGTKDLQQCADAVMRLRAEYLYSRKRYDEIHFNFTNGFRADYSAWANGKRIKVSGSHASWYDGAEKDYSHAVFLRYLEMVFAYAGTLSLAAEMQPVLSLSLRAGDVWIEGGSPGHAVIVIDTAVNLQTGKRVFLLAQSYMPAQDIHILVNPASPALSPWYELKSGSPLVTPEWTFGAETLRRYSE